MANRTPLFAAHVEACAELRMQLIGTASEPLAEQVYTQAEQIQMALWRAVGELRHGEIPPRTERSAQRINRDLARLKQTG